MRRGQFLLLFLCLMFGVIKASAFDLILPSEKKSTVSTKNIIFMGNAKKTEEIAINGERIYVASNGAFTHTVKLKDGENRIAVKSQYRTQFFNVTRISNSEKKEPELFEYDCLKQAFVNNDGVPLRSTPVDAGLNRMSHLFADTILLLSGEKGDFYRVFLSKNKVGWIAKKDVIVDEQRFSAPAEFVTMNAEKFKNGSIQNIDFSKNLPFTIEDGDNDIKLRIYNPELSENSVYNFEIQKPDKYSYHIDLDYGQFTFKVSEIPTDKEDLNIIIDAGHGGRELGAIGCLGDYEKDVNLKIAQELKNILQNKGYNVLLTRECDGDMGLKERVQFARDNNANIFVSIHLNSIGDIDFDVNKNRGTSVYYFNRNSKKLAEKINKSLVGGIKTRNDGVRTASFAVIRPTEYVSVLVEVAYMTNPKDTMLYKSEDFANNAALGIATGIIDFLEKKK